MDLFPLNNINNSNNRNGNKHKGNKYEEKAVDYLKSVGYLIYGKNLYMERREVDIIAIDTENKITILVEVKYRRNIVTFFPTISVMQQKNLWEIGLMLEKLDNNLPPMWQIDFIVFSDDEMHHIRNI